MDVINEIINEIKEKCDINTFNYLNNFIITKLKGYKLTKEESNIVKYDENKNTNAIKMFLISKKLQGLSERTLKAYKYDIEKFINSVNKDFINISTEDIRYYLACYQLKGDVSQVTIDNTRRYINTFFQWLEDEEYISKNPCKKIKKVKTKKKVKKAFTFEEIEKLKINCTTKREIALITVLLSTGCRANEVTNIKLSDITPNGEIKITGKGNKERMVFLNAESTIRINDYINSKKFKSKYLFSAEIKPYGKVGEGVIEKIVKKVGERAGIENVHPHRFRRTCATIAYKRGMPIEEIKKMLGHEDLGTTQIYVQVESEDVKKSHEKYMN